MDNEFLIGLVVTVVLGAVGIWVSAIALRKSGLKYLQVDAGTIFNYSSRDLGEIKILINGKPTDQEVIFLRALILNDGANDIDKTTIHEPMKISFAAPIEVFSVELEKGIPDVVLTHSGSAITCDWKLLKKNEYFTMKIVLCYSQAGETEAEKLSSWNLLKEYTSISHRITNVGRVRTDSFDESVTEKPRIKNMLFPGIFLALFGALFVFGLYDYKYNFTYQFSGIADESFVWITPKEKGIALIEGNGYKDSISLVDFPKKYRVKDLKIQESSITSIVTLMIILGGSSVWLVSGIRSYLKSRRIVRIFKGTD